MSTEGDTPEEHGVCGDRQQRRPGRALDMRPESYRTYVASPALRWGTACSSERVDDPDWRAASRAQRDSHRGLGIGIVRCHVVVNSCSYTRCVQHDPPEEQGRQAALGKGACRGALDKPHA